jgi:hypothetical protein
MATLLERLMTAARRTAQPYNVGTRTITAFVAVVVIAFLALVALRMFLAAEPCPEVPIVPEGSKAPVMVSVACQSGLSWGAQFATSVIDNLAAGLIVALVGALLLLLIRTEEHVEEDISSLAPWNIRAALLEPLLETKNYRFRGRSGRFVRATVMPALDEAGRRETQRRVLSMLLPDPADEANLGSYAHYRNSLAFENREWTVDGIRVEIVATILKAAYLANRNKFFEAHVYLKSDYAIFRMDMSDARLVMTREDPKWPGIICSGRSKFYASYEEEFRLEAEAAQELELRKANLPLGFDESHINPALAAVGVQLTLEPPACLLVVEAMKKPEAPYA